MLPDVTTALPGDFKLGVEIEIPLRPEGVKPLTTMGEPSDDDKYRSIELGHWLGGEMTYERIGSMEYGIEARTPDGGIYYTDLPEWYEHTVEEIEDKFGREMEPVGFYGDTTAGLHTHISPLTEEQAKRLCELSSEPWMHVFACTSVASTDTLGCPADLYPVFRSGNGYSKYCKLDEVSESYESCVKSCGGSGHYEWRLPEPMHAEHFSLIVEFLARFMNNPDAAAEWAKHFVDCGDKRLTSVQRANEIEKPLIGGNYNTEATQLLYEVTK